MNNIIIGTAGHIDHGKTTLIKALSGIETDTTTEEKERGMSINLGFAYFDLPSGKRCGVVDVPGHEKFIKNMLAGVSGINLVLLLIDSREGIMPQTKEHIDILSLLGIKDYIIVMTKIDLVEEDYRSLVREDILEFIKGTNLEGSKIIEVDSISRRGIDELINEIDRKTEDIESYKELKNARLNIDRAFQVKGFGTVVTGTLTEGTISVGDEIAVYPQNIKAKIRNIQVHEKDVKSAYRGQRTAINLSNVKLSDVGRGHTLATLGSMTNTYIIDTKIKMIKDTDYTLKLWDRLRVYVGTTEVMARAVPLGKDVIKKDETGFVQLRLEEEISVKNYDQFIIRTYSPMITVGGGIILDANPKKHKRFNEEILSKLKSQAKGSTKDLIENYILSIEEYLIYKKDVAKAFEKDEVEVDLILENLIQEKKILKVTDKYIHTKKYEDIKEKLLEIVSEYHQKNKLKMGIPKIELPSKTKISQKEIYGILDLLIEEKIFKLERGFVSLKDFSINYDNKQLKEKNRIEKTLLLAGFTPPSIDELTKNNKANIQLIESLVGNSIVKLGESIFLHIEVYEEAVSKVRNHFKDNDKMTLAEFRDMTNSSRRYSMAILEYMDDMNITKRVENYRVLSV